MIQTGKFETAISYLPKEKKIYMKILVTVFRFY